MNSLDVAQQAALDSLLSQLCEVGMTIVMSSHDLNHTLRFASQVWLMRRGELLATGPTAEVLTTENLAKAYDMRFKKIETDGHQILLAAP